MRKRDVIRDSEVVNMLEKVSVLFQLNCTPCILRRMGGEVPDREANIISIGCWVADSRLAMRLETFPVPLMRRTIGLDISLNFNCDGSDEKVGRFTFSPLEAQEEMTWNRITTRSIHRKYKSVV